MSWIGGLFASLGSSLGFGDSNLISRGVDSISSSVLGDDNGKAGLLSSILGGGDSKESKEGGDSKLLIAALTTGASLLNGAQSIKAQKEAQKRADEAENLQLLLKLAELKKGGGGGGGVSQSDKLAAAYGGKAQAMGNQYAQLGQTLGTIYR